MRAFARPLSPSWDQVFHWHTASLPLPGAGHIRAKSASLMAWHSRKKFLKSHETEECPWIYLPCSKKKSSWHFPCCRRPLSWDIFPLIISSNYIKHIQPTRKMWDVETGQDGGGYEILNGKKEKVPGYPSVKMRKSWKPGMIFGTSRWSSSISSALGSLRHTSSLGLISFALGIWGGFCIPCVNLHCLCHGNSAGS